METVRLEVRNRSVLLDRRDFVFFTEDGLEVEKTTIEGVIARVERFVKGAAAHTKGASRGVDGSCKDVLKPKHCGDASSSAQA